MEPQKVTLFGNSFFADVIKDLQIILDLGDPKSNNLHTHTRRKNTGLQVTWKEGYIMTGQN
jgi:hypothetical protein